MNNAMDLFDNECEAKLSFKTIEEAEGAAATADWRYGRKKNQRLKPYLCHKCGQFHLSTQYRDKDDKQNRV